MVNSNNSNIHDSFNTTNNITNNIQINLLAYKHTDLSHITDEEILKCINSNKPVDMIKSLIKNTL